MKRVISLLLLSSLALAGPCDDVISAAQAASAACNSTVDAYRATVDSQDKLIVELTKQRNDALREAGSGQPLLPFYVWMLLGGAAATVAIGVRR